jgi:hypothetical protein
MQEISSLKIIKITTQIVIVLFQNGIAIKHINQRVHQ